MVGFKDLWSINEAGYKKCSLFSTYKEVLIVLEAGRLIQKVDNR